MLCDLLMAHRHECQQNNIVFSKDTPKVMRDMLAKVVQEKRAMSFQTTIIAAQFISSIKGITANIIKCGDSAFFSCSPEGELLTSSLAVSTNGQSLDEPIEEKQLYSFESKRIAFGPEDEILVRVESRLSQCQSIAEKSGIENKHWENWLVCAPVDACKAGNPNRHATLSERRSLILKPSDLLLVPRFLYGTQLTSQGQRYQVIRYSSTIRPVISTKTPTVTNSFNDHNPTTMVLPDHFYRGCYDLFQDQFPPQTHFVLCSDGFYGSFPGWQQLWTWLQENADRLRNDEEREAILQELHADLHARGSDDDISFIWVRPKNSLLTKPAKNHWLQKQKGRKKSCQQK